MPYLRIFAILTFLVVAVIPDAHAISRCIVNGQTVFQDTPCVGSMGTHAEDFNRRAKQQEIDNERLLKNSLAEAAMQPEERSKRAQKSEALARSAVVERMIDPKSTDLRNVKSYAGVGFNKVYGKGVSGPPVIDVVCGEVNSKNRMGGYVGFRPFYWTSHDGKVVMADPNVLEDIMNTMIIRTCTGLAN